MALTTANVRTPVTGLVSRGPTSVAVPTATGTTAPVGMTDLGFIGEDGVTTSKNVTTKPIKAFQYGTTVRRVITDSEYTVKFTLLETSKETLETYYAATSTPGATEGSINVNPSATGGTQAWCFDYADNNGAEAQRLFIPTGEITEFGDLVYKNGEAVGYPVTVTGYPDENGNAATLISTALKTP